MRRCGNACTAKIIVQMKEEISGFAFSKVLENVQEYTLNKSSTKL